ncbi:MAG: hypothetical protein V3T05_13005 [Myxococcota bacterium]
MKTAFGQLLRSLVPAQSGSMAADGGGSGLFIILGVGLATATVVAIWAFLRWRTTRQRLAALTVKHKTTTEAHRALLDKERKQAKTLDDKRDNLKNLKRDLGSQKKKNHDLQEKLKEVRADLRDHHQEAEKAPVAFDVTPATKAPTEEPKKVTAPVKKADEERKAPARKAESEPDPARVAAEIQRLKQDLETERATSQNQRAELKRHRRRAEDLRRVDLVTKGQTATLEDRVRTLGRQYYDTISELAALKGEVQPPKPRDLEPAKAVENADEAFDDTSTDDSAARSDDVQATAAPATDVGDVLAASADEPTDPATEAHG